MPPWPILFHLLSQKLKLGKNSQSIVIKTPILIVPFYWPATLSKSLTDILVIICKHFPGDNHFDEMREKGLLWLTRNGYLVGEICLPSFPYIHYQPYHSFITQKTFKKIAGTVLLLPISTCVRLQTSVMVITTIQSYKKALTKDVLVEVLKLCCNAWIVFFEKSPTNTLYLGSCNDSRRKD